jgi:outer membrane lipoprotein-sorting protein
MAKSNISTRRTRQFVGLGATLVLFAAIRVARTRQAVNQQRLDRDLIAAINTHDEARAIALLDRGADANTYDNPQPALSSWQLLVEPLQPKHTSAFHPPSALQLVLDWRPATDSAVKPTSETTPLIQALVKHGAKLGGREIFARMARTYAFCSSYRDTGSVKSAGSGYQPSLTFRTAFVRPEKFYFDYRSDSSDHHVIWETDATIHTWWSKKSGVNTSSFAMAIDGATGVSTGVAATVPGMLTPDRMDSWGGLRLDYPEIQYNGLQTIDGVPCYALRPVEINPSMINITAIYVDARSFLLRRLVAYYVSTYSELVTNYRPEVDVNIVDSTFRFKPPK